MQLRESGNQMMRVHDSNGDAKTDHYRNIFVFSVSHIVCPSVRACSPYAIALLVYAKPGIILMRCLTIYIIYIKMLFHLLVVVVVVVVVVGAGAGADVGVAVIYFVLCRKLSFSNYLMYNQIDTLVMIWSSAFNSTSNLLSGRGCFAIKLRFHKGMILVVEVVSGGNYLNRRSLRSDLIPLEKVRNSFYIFGVKYNF
uniref:Uncharacterized protein n=1 Tax=Glossina brevipalpis TaxID=37001 RepID=A0A1A9WLC0_9MUSC